MQAGLSLGMVLTFVSLVCFVGLSTRKNGAIADSPTAGFSGPLPKWYCTSVPALLGVTIILAPMLAVAMGWGVSLDDGLQQLLWSSNDGTVLVPSGTVPWAVIPLMMLSIVIGSLIGKILLIPFPVFEACTVLYGRANIATSNVSNKDQAVSERMMELLKTTDVKTLVHSQWISIFKLAAIMWVLFGTCWFVLLDDYVKVGEKSVKFNTVLSAYETTVPLNQCSAILSNKIEKGKGGDTLSPAFILNAPNGFSTDIWPGSFGFNEADGSSVVQVARILKKNGVSVKVQPLPPNAEELAPVYIPLYKKLQEIFDGEEKHKGM